VYVQVDLVHRMCDKYPDTFEFAWTAADVMRIFKEGKIASVCGAEGGHQVSVTTSTGRKYRWLPGTARGWPAPDRHASASLRHASASLAHALAAACPPRACRERPLAAARDRPSLHHRLAGMGRSTTRSACSGCCTASACGT
jgi:hypothetical protein